MKIFLHAFIFLQMILLPLVPALSQSLPSQFQPSQVKSAGGFTNVADVFGVEAVDVGSGVSWVDFDKDGLLDLYVSTPGANYIFRNAGSGFVRGPDDLVDYRNSSACAWADYDGDRCLDLFIANYGENGLFHRVNDRYVDVAPQLGLNETGYQTAAAWADFDNDGDVDLFVGTWGGASYLYRNEGSSFTEIASQAGITHPQYVWSAAWGDYDSDNDLDLYISCSGRNFLYRNDSGVFTEVAQKLGIAGSSGYETRGCAWADFDNDGDLDLFVVGYLGPNSLFRNDGNRFTEIAAQMGLAHSGAGNGCAWADFDLDGDLDLYVTYEDGPNKLFRNDDSLFTDVSALMGVADTLASTGCAWGDYDRDGDPDLYVVNTGGQPNRLYRNDRSGNHWLHIDLRGTKSSWDAIGAKAVLYAGNRRQLRYVDGGSGYFSQNSLTLEFGLGNDTIADSLKIIWPSGTTDLYYDIPADQRLRLIEGRKRIGPSILAVPGDYPTVQSALDAAFAGDTVLVDDGIYYENIIWPATKGLCLLSKNGPENTILDGSRRDRVLYLNSGAVDSTTIIQGFTIRNGLAYDGAGILVENCSPTIRNNRIINNRAAALGGAIKLLNSRATVQDNYIAFNHAGYGGGAIFAEKPSSQNPEYPPDVPGPKILNNHFIENTSDYLGGAIYYRAVWLQISGNVFVGNRSDFGGAIYCGSYDAKGDIYNNLIFRNTARVEAGGIFAAWYSHGTIASNHILQNYAGRLGGGIFYFLYSRMAIGGALDLQNDIYHNSASEQGDQLYSLELEPEAVQHNFWGSSHIDSMYSGIAGVNPNRWWPPAKLPRPISRSTHTAGDSLWFGECLLTIDSLVLANSQAAIEITTYPDSLPQNMPFSGAIQKFYQIRVNGTRFIRARIRFYYADDELVDSGIKTPVKLMASKWDGSDWIDYTTAVDTAGRSATCTGDPAGIWILRLREETSAQEPHKTVHRFSLEQNYPNPFNSVTTITYRLKKPASVKVVIFNSLGQKVALLFSGFQQAGRHSVLWDAETLPSGVYIYTVEMRDPRNKSRVFFHQRRKALLLK